MTWPPTSLNATQQRNANTIIAVGQRLGASQRDIQIALMTAMQESELININSGDRDSLGLFQQRAAWAPAAARMDPVQSATMFFTGGQGGQRGLLNFQNRDNMSLTQAAQAVQVSAYPDAYAKWESLAQTAMGSAAPAVSTTAAAPMSVGNARSDGVTDTAAPGADTTTAAPGAGEVSAPGAGEVTSPGAAAITDPTQSSSSTAGMSQDQFNQLFPDAAANGTFTGALTKDANARRSDVVNTAMSWLGTKYTWGGNSRATGVDCSGLVQQVYKAFGIDLPRLSADQARAGQRVAYSQLKPGDLLAWDENDRNVGADHISVYIGNGQIIEAPRPGLAVRIRTLDPNEIKTGMGVHFAQMG